MTDDMQRFKAQEPASREEILLLLEELIRECHSKVAGDGRIRDVEKDRMRKGYADSASNLANAYRRLLKDEELEEMSEEIEELKSQAQESEWSLPVDS